MSEPSLERLPDDIERLLDAERREPEAFEALRPGVRAGLQASLPLVWALPAPPAPSGLLRGTLRPLAKRWLLPLTFGVGAGSGALVQARLSRAHPEPAALSLPAPAQPAPLPPLPVAPEPSAPLPPRPRAARPHPEGGSPGALAEESVLLEQVRTALSRGNGTRALEAIAEDQRRFPQGELAEEREALRIQALVQAGRPGEARAAAARFRADHPKSPLQPVVEAALQSIP